MIKQKVSPPPPRSVLVERLKSTMALRDLTPRAWSLAAKGNADAVRNILRGGSRSPQWGTIVALANAANVAPEYLTGQTESPNGLDDDRVVPAELQKGQIDVLGYIGAGDQVYHFGLGDARERVPAPPGVERGVAAIVRGTSMMPVYRPNEMVIASAFFGEPSALTGQDCFVQIKEGPLYLKKLRKVVKGRAYLESYDSAQPIIANQIIDWIAPVAWVRRG